MSSRSPTFPRSKTSRQDADRAWHQFIESHGAQLLRIARYHARNEDQAQDCFLFICEKLCARQARRLRQFDPGKGVPFAGWLNSVANNLAHDWRRAEFGRLRTPKAILELDALAQRAFHLSYERRLDQSACLEFLRAEFPDLTAAKLASALARVQQALTHRQRWRMVNRPTRAVPEHRSHQSGGVVLPVRRKDEPDALAADAEQRRMLQNAINRLEPEDRLLLRLRFEEMLPYDQVARLLGLNNLHQARRRVEQALSRLRVCMDDA